MNPVIQSLLDNKAIDLAKITYDDIWNAINEYPILVYNLYIEDNIRAMCTIAINNKSKSDKYISRQELEDQERVELEKLRPIQYWYVKPKDAKGYIVDNLNKIRDPTIIFECYPFTHNPRLTKRDIDLSKHYNKLYVDCYSYNSWKIPAKNVLVDEPTTPM